MFFLLNSNAWLPRRNISGKSCAESTYKYLEFFFMDVSEGELNDIVW